VSRDRALGDRFAAKKRLHTRRGCTAAPTDRRDCNYAGKSRERPA
jgi:hypothetical protein